MSDGEPDPIEALRAIGERIELLSTDPDRVRSRWVSLVRPLLRVVRWQPSFKVEALERLLLELRAKPPGPARSRSARPEAGGAGAADASFTTTGTTVADPALKELVNDVLAELAANVTGAEIACVVNGYVPTSRAAWLRRLYEVVVRATKASLDPGDATTMRMVVETDPMLLLPPLARQAPEDPETLSAGASLEGDSAVAPARPAAEMSEDDARLLELHLATIDHLLDASRAETEFLGRRRRLLEAARQLLLETSAALPLDRRGVEARRAHIAEQIVRINRLEAAGVSCESGLLYQALGAVSRGDRERLHATLGALDMVALAAGDAATASRASAAIRRLWGHRNPDGPKARARSIERSTTELFGAGVIDRVAQGYREARVNLAGSLASMSPEEAADNRGLEAYLRDGGEAATLAAALAVDGCFDVGGVLSPVRVVEHELRARAVSYPTPKLMLVPAQEIGDIPSALIDDPRRVLLSLAEGRLLTRKFIQVDAVTRTRTKLVGEARIYLLDGSDSMLNDGEGLRMGARARMRDAILLAELATLHKRYLMHGRRVRVTLHYRYFTKVLWPITKVDSVDTAMQAMVEVIRTPRRGGTDIEGALLSSFQLIREARAADPDLARAQIVLVTDGDAPVRADVIRAERERASDVPIGVSVIALGEENSSLRDLVARQRARGERAFYHFIDDAALRSIVDSRVDRGPSIHLDEALLDDANRAPAEIAAELREHVGELLEELAALSRERHAGLVAAAQAIDASGLAAEVEGRAYAEVGLAFSSAVSEGERARREALDRDRCALEARFARWFPAPTEERPPAGAPRADGYGQQGQVDIAITEEILEGKAERADLDAVTIALATISEVISEVGGSALSRQADAIEILERLLPDARLSPARYLSVLRAYPAAVAGALRSVRGAAGV